MRQAGHHHNVKQGSPEHMALRQSKVCTGSEFAAAIGLNPYCSRRKLYDIKVEGLKDRGMADDFGQAALSWGQLYEPQARSVLSEFILEQPIQEVGFYDLPGDARFGDSPDGIVETWKDPVEIKCPFTPSASVRDPLVYQQVQCLAHMAVTGASKCHFFNFDPFGGCKYTVVPWVEDDWTQIKAHLDLFALHVAMKDPPPRIKRKPILRVSDLI